MADKPRMKPPRTVAAVIPAPPQPRKGYRPPHGTEYVMRFDEPTDSYFGRIDVPDHPSMMATARGRRELYHRLDREYLKAQEAKETGNG